MSTFIVDISQHLDDNISSRLGTFQHQLRVLEDLDQAGAKVGNEAGLGLCHEGLRISNLLVDVGLSVRSSGNVIDAEPNCRDCLATLSLEKVCEYSV